MMSVLLMNRFLLTIKRKEKKRKDASLICFKWVTQVLADSVGVPCQLVKGQRYRGSDDVAMNIVKISDGK